jgi:hypothetical protein
MRSPQEVSRLLRVAMSALLLALPLILAGHAHADHSLTPSSCHACVAARHDRAATSAAPEAIAPVRYVVEIPAAPAGTPPTVVRVAHAGRAPPIGSPVGVL